MNTPPDNRRILVIDDHRAIHEDFRKILARGDSEPSALERSEVTLLGGSAAPAPGQRFEIDSAYQGKEGMRLVKQAAKEGRPYALAFVDVRMPPGWDGIETTVNIWQVDPNLQIVICTAFADYTLDEILARLRCSDRLLILKKPFDNIEVVQLANALTEKWRLQHQATMDTEKLEQRVAERTREVLAVNEKLQTEITERARAEESLRQSQKLDAIGQLAGGVAHDFNNLLTIIRGYTTCLLADECLDPKTRSFLSQVDNAAQRAASLTRQLLAFSRKQVMQVGVLDLNEAVEQLAIMLQRVLGEDIALQINANANCSAIRADRTMIEQIILNLAVNARDAMPKGGQLLISTLAVEFGEDAAQANPKARAGHFVCLCVADTGCGIAPELMPRLFEPFFTTKQVGQGTGLGLATVYGITRQHEGWIDVESAPGQGTVFKVFLPASSEPAGLSALIVQPPTTAGGDETVLLVEDEPVLRDLLRMILHEQGYRVLAAKSGPDALAVWHEHAAEIELLLTDLVMPDGMSGLELAAKLQSAKPDLKVIYSSGYSLELAGRECLLSDGANFLPKPYTPQKLAAAIRHCLDGTVHAHGTFACIEPPLQ